MMDGRYGYCIFRAKHLGARRADKFEDDGDTEYYESADWYYRVEWDYLDGEEWTCS